MSLSLGNGLSSGKIPIKRIHAPTDSSLKVSQVVKGEMSAKTTYQRSAKGPVSISECDAGGKYIMLENTGKKVRPARAPHYRLRFCHVARQVDLLCAKTNG